MLLSLTKSWLVIAFVFHFVNHTRAVATTSSPSTPSRLPLVENKGKQIKLKDLEQDEQASSNLTPKSNLSDGNSKYPPKPRRQKSIKIEKDPTLKAFKPPKRRLDDSEQNFTNRLNKAQSKCRILHESKAEIAKYFPNESEEKISLIFIGYNRDKRLRENTNHNINRRFHRRNPHFSATMTNKDRKAKADERVRLAKEAQDRYQIRTLLKRYPEDEDLWKQAAQIGVTPSNLYTNQGRQSLVESRVKEYLIRVGLINEEESSKADLQPKQASSSATTRNTRSGSAEDSNEFGVIHKGPRSKGRRSRLNTLTIDRESTTKRQPDWSPTSSSSWDDAIVRRRKRTKMILVNHLSEKELTNDSKVDVTAMTIPRKARTNAAVLALKREEAKQQAAERKKKTREMIENIFGKF